MAKEEVFATVERNREQFAELARDIWERPELAFRETRSAAALQRVLREHGFEIETGIADIETAFLARYGEADPVVATMGEFDALPGLSQEVGAEREPAEEAGGGKVYMVRAGAFDDVDAVVSWHPGWYNAATRESCLANDSFVFTFEGESSHAAASPEAGRSALDAVQLMNTGVEFMREHVVDEARIHYVIQDGGEAPNVVPPTASVEYTIRAPKRDQVEHITDWVMDVAEGAALMTDTEFEFSQLGAMYGVLPNETLADAIHRNMVATDGMEFDDEGLSLARDLRESLGDVSGTVATLPNGHRSAAADAAMYTEPVEVEGGGVGMYSTDSGDVSRTVPLGRFRAATWPVGTPPHSWQAVAASGSIGIEGALFAAKVIGGTLYDLLDDGELLAAARDEFETKTDGFEYESPLLPDTTPANLTR
ncbi:amidohydrolase [Halobacteriales archaeon QS_5_70_15]|nr:MAG: amidohydrolase [Halobacteriales archaeon QS_5_70_15]